MRRFTPWKLVRATSKGFPSVESQFLQYTATLVLASYGECSVGGDCSDPYLTHFPPPQRKTPEKTLFLGDCVFWGEGGIGPHRL